MFSSRVIAHSGQFQICLTPEQAEQGKKSASLKTDSPATQGRTQCLQIGYKHRKQHWRTKALHKFGNFIRRRNSRTPNASSDQSKEPSEHSSGVETTEKLSEVHCEYKTIHNVPTNHDERRYSYPNTGTDEYAKSEVIGPEDLDDRRESSVEVLALMQPSQIQAAPASDQILSFKCCCSDADLRKPSMCGDRACVTCSVHDHRLMARQVSMAAEAAAQAAASVLAVPQVQVDREEVSYTSAPTTPGNKDVQNVLHSVRSALENRLRYRYHRPERLNRPTGQADVATCTTPLPEPTVKPILLTLSKMYQKNLYMSALLHNLSSLDVQKLVSLVNECRTKIEQLEEVCKQKIEPVIVDVEGEQKKATVDAAVGEGMVCQQLTTSVVDVAVGVNVKIEKVDKEIQEMADSTRNQTDEKTETTGFGVEVGVQVSCDGGLGARGVAGLVKSLTSEDQWGRVSQLSADLSTADLSTRSLDYCHSYLMDPLFMMQFESPKPESSFPEIGSIPDDRHQVSAAPKVHSLSSQKARPSRSVKHPVRPNIRHSSILAYSPMRLRTTQVRQVKRSPARQEIPSAAIGTHPAPRQHNTAVSARFAGGRSVMNHFPLRRGLPLNKPTGIKVVSTLRK